MYRTKPLFPYAEGQYMVLPEELLGKFEVGEGEIVKGKGYLIYIKKGTDNEIKQRLIEEYAEYAEEKRKKGVYI